MYDKPRRSPRSAIAVDQRVRARLLFAGHAVMAFTVTILTALTIVSAARYAVINSHLSLAQAIDSSDAE
jgi:hypothetical protein